MIRLGGIFGMPKLIALLVLLLFAGTARAQIYEVGLTGGASAYRGDLNLDKYFNKIYPAGGLMLRYNHNQHVSARINGSYTVLRGSDLRSRNPYIIFPPNREYEFETTLLELSMQAEINFLPFTVGSEETRFTPYLFGGIGGIYFDPKVIDPTTGEENITDAHWYNNEEPDDFKKYSIISLFGFGFRFNLSEDFAAGIEWGMRYAGLPGNQDIGTDYLDMVSLKGNPKKNDWYSIVGVTFTYKFLDRSRPPCPLYVF